LQLAGSPYVGPHGAASAVSMDKTLTKLVADNAGITQASWILVRNSELQGRMDAILNSVEEKFTYPVFVKPAGTGSSVGVSKVNSREELQTALLQAGRYDEKILVEEFIYGREVEVAVMGNAIPVASVVGEIDSGADFYDYDAKYVTDTSVAYIPARIPEDVAEELREKAVKVYSAIGCRGLSRVDFFVSYKDNRVVFNEINTIPGFTSISMYPKLFAASGIPYNMLIDQLLKLAMEA
ncbi:MAG: D-alanine--D-alanine ligase, partial [Oscillospiraceae bacterium]|nr:D-alanine--D-alanine ligase [Oscillospiraceae bacterium]